MSRVRDWQKRYAVPVINGFLSDRLFKTGCNQWLKDNVGWDMRDLWKQDDGSFFISKKYMIEAHTVLVDIVQV